MIAGEPVAGPAEPGLDLIGDQQDAVRGAELGQARQEPFGRNNETTLALDRLDQHRGDVTFTDLGVNQSGDDVQRLRRAPLRAAGPAQRIGHRHTVDLTGERAELVLVRHVLRGQRHGQVGPAVVRVVERDNRGPPRGVPGDLDGVLHRLRAGVDQRRPLVVIAGGAAGEFLAHGHVLLIRRDHEAGVSEPRGLLTDPRGHPRRAVAHRGHRDPRPEVDERVAVCVDQHPAARRRDEHRQDVADPPGHAGVAPGQQRPRGGTGDLGDKAPLLGETRAAG